MTDIAWGPNGKDVFERTYSRVKPDGTHETWEDTVERVVEGNAAFVKDILPVGEHEKQRLKGLILEFGLLPGGRHLWATGAKGNHIANCFAAPSTDGLLAHVRFMFLRLMEGGGVGSNYSCDLMDYHYATTRPLKLHLVCDPAHKDYAALKAAGVLSEEYVEEWEGAYRIQDSREGWADGLCDLLSSWVEKNPKHDNRVFDLSLIRPEGQPIKGFGGFASGPLALAIAMHKANQILTEDFKQGKGFVDNMAVAAIDHAIAESVMAGGSRRSARMSLMHWQDPNIFRFLKCKEGAMALWTTNISVEIDDAFCSALEANDSHAVAVWLHLIRGMYANGEPGWFNTSLVNRDHPGNVIVRQCNPCQPAFAPVIKRGVGLATMGDIAEGDQIWSKDGWVRVVKKWSTGVKPVYRYQTTGGAVISTDNHRVVQNGEKVEVRHATTIDTLGRPDDLIRIETSAPIVDVIPLGEHEVFDITVDGPSHTYWSGGHDISNCGEVPLSEYESCILGHLNMAHAVPRGRLDADHVREHLELMTRFLIRATFAPIADEKQRAIVEKNRRIAVGMLGVQTALVMAGIQYSEVWENEEVREFLQQASATVDQAAQDYAWELRIPVPIATTTMAPTGSIAKLPGVTEGIAPVPYLYFERRIRYNTLSPRQAERLLEMASEGKQIETDQYDASGNTMVVVEPMRSNLLDLPYGEECAESATEMGLEAQLRMQLLFATEYVNNAISATLQFNPEKVSIDELESTLRPYIGKLKGCTVFPEVSRPQAPYTPITKEQWEAAHGGTDDGVDMDCGKGGCPIK